MYVGIDGLCMVFFVGTDNEAVVGLNIAGLVNSMIARAQPPCWIPPLMAVAVWVVMMLEMRPGREREVHQMSDGGLAFAAVEGSHRRGLSHGIIVC